MLRSRLKVFRHTFGFSGAKPPKEQGDEKSDGETHKQKRSHYKRDLHFYLTDVFFALVQILRQHAQILNDLSLPMGDVLQDHHAAQVFEG